MNRERWQLVEQLYHSALEKDEGERGAYLQASCNNDPELRREVESLLAAGEAAPGFIESPALEVAAKLLTKEEVEADDSPPLPAGTSISHYQIVEKIGAGGMGEVYRAHDPRLGRDVAIKILPQVFAGDAERLRRFEQEARAAAALNHPNIVAIHDVGTWEYGTPYVVSELLAGETLRARINKGALSVRNAVEISSQIASGLAAAHHKGIVHRDLKPENIFLTHEGHVKILDFGLAKLLPESPVASDLSTMTSTLSVMGTLGYMSPEQVRGQAVDQRTDIFSLGAVIYELLSGQRAFKGETPADTVSAILTRDPPELTSNARGIPPALNHVVRRALEKNPGDRFHSAKDLAFALAAVSEGHEIAGTRSWSRLGWKVPLASGMVLLLAFALWFVSSRVPPRGVQTSSIPAPIRSLAVLPLENVSGSSDQDYFADGMTDELITQLAQISEVRVISRSSAMQFKGTHRPLAEIARALGVDTVVEGSVLKTGHKVRVTAQLIKTSTDEHLWAHSYDGDVSDVIRLQDDIARSVADAIKVQLQPAERARISSSPQPTSVEAYDDYLKGLSFSAKLTPDGLQKGFELFNQSIQKDPAFAPAYGALAESYSWAAGLEIQPYQEALPKAEAAAKKALAIDPNLATAHHSLAWVKYARDWDFAGAVLEFQRAIELSPNNSTAHLWYGMYLAEQGHAEESFVHMRRAKELDPLAPIMNLTMTPLLTSRQYDRLIAEVVPMLKVDPQDGILHWLLTSAYEQKGDLIGAIDAQERAAIAFGEDATHARQRSAQMRYAVSRNGAKGYWLSREQSTPADSDPYQRAIIEAHLRKTDAVFQSLEKAYAQHSIAMLYWMHGEPAFDPYREDLRFRDLQRRIGQS